MSIVTILRIATIACCLVFQQLLAAGIVPTELRCEYLVDPIGIDVVRPRLSWKLAVEPADQKGKAQSAFQILVASGREQLDQNIGNIWDTGRVHSPENLHHTYKGAPLFYGSLCWWKVRVWDEGGACSTWSPPARFSIGPLQESDWSADWIGPSQENSGGKKEDAISYDYAFAKEFVIQDTPKNAFAYLASLGYHELHVNDKRAGNLVLTPHISDLSSRARYVTYDLSGLLKEGKNRLRILANSGWAEFPRFGGRAIPLVRCQLDIRCADGQKLRVTTDPTWQAERTADKRLQPWVQGQFGGDWREEGVEPAVTRKFEVPVEITAEKTEPNRILETLQPVEIEKLDDGWRIDFGRSFTGWLDVPLEAPAGTTVRMSVSEREDQDVTYKQIYHLVVPADGSGRFRHQFNYTAGRWLKVEGPVEKPEGAQAFLIHTDYPELTRFHCSSDLLNRIWETTLWTFRCLSLGGYVVDCPHRERLGYGGDAHATIPTGLAHYGLGAFYTKWMQDWRDMQSENGDLPYTAPTYEGGGGPAWSGVVIQLPWQLYVHYGDRRVLEENWPMMSRWLGFLDTQVRDGLLQHYGSEEWGFLGDWVPPGRRQPKGTRVDDHSTLFFNNCYWYWSLKTAAEIADVLGRVEEVKRLRDRASEVRETVHKHFWDSERGVYANGEQPYLAFPLLVGLPPEELRPYLERKLEETILENDKGHINAGISGHVLLLEQLTRARRSDLVFEMVSKTTYPSWGYMLENGATTIWEQWDGENSRCHSSFLGIGAWFIRGLAGIEPDPKKPGYKHFFIQPQVCGNVTSCQASYNSIRGPIESSWKIEDGAFELNVVIPPGTSATVILPGEAQTEGKQVGPGTHQLTASLGSLR